jgi:hypothetical protein
MLKELHKVAIASPPEDWRSRDQTIPITATRPKPARPRNPDHVDRSGNPGDGLANGD